MREKRLLSLDVGTYKTGFAVIDETTGEVLEFGKEDNINLLARLRDDDSFDVAVIEDIQFRGQLVGRDTFETLKWIGKFAEALNPTPVVYLFRKTIVTELTGDPRAKDKNVRQAVIDHYGGILKAIGGKKCPHCKGKGWRGAGRPTCIECNGTGWEYPPGPLHGVAGDVWSAIAVALCYQTKRKRGDYENT